jgi:hypothetical protein
LTVYAHGGLFILQNYIDPVAFRNLDRLQQLVMNADSQGAQAPVSAKPRPRSGHRMPSAGIKL